jgi:hypothetical protein
MTDNTHNHDEIHLPAPSAAPIILAAGMTMTAIGLVSPAFLIVGIILLAVGVGMWAFGPN